MTTWHQFAVLQSQFATSVRARFAEATHHVLATLRLDGSPRVSGTEVEFTDTDLTIGSMAAARKADDLLRDPRFALHSNPALSRHDVSRPNRSHSSSLAGCGGRSATAADIAAGSGTQHPGEMAIEVGLVVEAGFGGHPVRGHAAEQ